ncbi:MAG: hypothetical protein OFPI_30210 [Osedax symbiont Rs2]|nr:MAG: hypothetical protein OFPI_30210 [Osedax symbiont Rs2]
MKLLQQLFAIDNNCYGHVLIVLMHSSTTDQILYFPVLYTIL